MSQECSINHNDFILYTSVLLVLVLIFPMLDLIIIRLTWFYKDDLFIPRDIEHKTAKLSNYNKESRFFPKSISSISTRSHPVHPLTGAEPTLVFSNNESQDIDESDTQRKLEDTIIYGKSSVKQGSNKATTIETTLISRSVEDYSLDSKYRETQQKHTVVHIESLPGIETPLELSARTRKLLDSQNADVRRETVKNLQSDLPEVTRVTPIMKLSVLPPLPNTGYKSSEFIESLADASVLYQDKYDVTYVSSRTNLIDTSSHGSSLKHGERKLLNRPDNNRRKLAKLDTHNP
ncbi:hypothetical protein LOD99_5072 [Oopsacas minuta]|uniref:Uncharacterized protein n=1 Tax=Oopsacas minuta TaxID=111878 RepID=A0AAV7JRF8_9METZ|nr:hypothetical protein LOD99_5072 [Oopsacas minuta]